MVCNPTYIFTVLANTTWIKLLHQCRKQLDSYDKTVFIAYYVYIFFFVMLRYETDGTVESPDEILGYLSMYDYIFYTLCLQTYLFLSTDVKYYSIRQLHKMEHYLYCIEKLNCSCVVLVINFRNQLG